MTDPTIGAHVGTVISVLVGVAGIVTAVICGRKYNKLLRDRHRFSWDDVVLGAQAVIKKTLYRFDPDIVVSFSDTALVVAGLVMAEMERRKRLPPFYCLMLEHKAENGTVLRFPRDDEYKVVSTHTWNIFVPIRLLRETEARILIVSDAVFTAESMYAVRELMVENGAKKENIRTCALVAFGVPEKRRLGDDLKVAYEVDHRQVYLPWGEAF